MKNLKLKMGIALIGMTVLLSGCNSGAKHFGGTTTIDLPQGVKFVNVSWKDTDLWYLTKPMKADDIEETYSYKEKSSFGVMEGTVIFKEHK